MYQRIDETIRKCAVSAPIEAVSVLAQDLKTLNCGGGLSGPPSDSVCARYSLAAKLVGTLFVRLQVETLRQTRDTRPVEDEEHVNPGDRLSG